MVLAGGAFELIRVPQYGPGEGMLEQIVNGLGIPALFFRTRYLIDYRRSALECRLFIIIRLYVLSVLVPIFFAMCPYNLQP